MTHLSAPYPKCAPESAEDIDCAKGKPDGNPRNVRMTSAVLKYIGEEGDPPGKWVVEVDIRDTVRNVTVPLRADFTLVAD